MSPKKYEVRLNFFSGFYESIHDGVFENEIDWILEEYGKEYDDFNFKRDFIAYAKSYVSAIASEIGMDLELCDLVSPREYNFSTNVITVWMKPKDLKKISSALGLPILKKIIKERFTSRDGFMSFYSNDINEWKEKPVEKWDCVELGTLLEAWLIDKEFILDGQFDLDYVGYEYCSGNGQYVDFEKLWDEEAEMEQKKLHEKELEMLSSWKNNVAQW